jgi:hypothetical protein
MNDCTREVLVIEVGTSLCSRREIRTQDIIIEKVANQYLFEKKRTLRILLRILSYEA